MGTVSQALTGAGLKLYVNNRVFGIVVSFEWSADGGRRAIMGLDQIVPFELAPGGNTVKMKIDCIRIKNDGGLEGRGIAASDHNLLLEKYISIILVDRHTGKTVFKCDRAAVNTQTWRVEARGLMRGSITLEGIDWKNESEA